MNVVESKSGTSVFDIIKRRRTIGQMTQQQPTRQQIERMLEAATYAPNHRVTEPWRFFVLKGAARERFGEVLARSLQARLKDAASELTQARIARERNKPLRAPIIITVAMVATPQHQGWIANIEKVEAAAAAVQNMLLTAEEMGLATLWATGEAAYDPLVKQWFGLTRDDHIVGFIYVGYPKVRRPMRVPTPFLRKTIWYS